MLINCAKCQVSNGKFIILYGELSSPKNLSPVSGEKNNNNTNKEKLLELASVRDLFFK